MLKENDIISKVLVTIDHCKGNMAVLKLLVTDHEYTPAKAYFSRTLVWKCCLITDSLKIQTWDAKLTASRVVYHELTNREDMQVPWWTLSEDNPFYRSRQLAQLASAKHQSKHPRTRLLRNLPRVSDVADPLRSPSPAKLAGRTRTPSRNSSPVSDSEDADLLHIIVLDIDRLFPGEPFFQPSNPSSVLAKIHLIEILYVWSKCNLVGYKQGLHEIVGLLYMHLYRESTVIPNTNTFTVDDLAILQLYNIEFLLHDIFTIFNKFLVQSGVIANFYENEAVLWKSIESFNANLMKVDQLIHYNLISKLKLESQLWIIRYLRLLLLRELGNDTTLLLWDKLVATQLTNHHGSALTALPDLIAFMTIQLHIQIKPQLITCDFSESLSLLLHYPAANTRDLHKDAVRLYEIRTNDLKLYEYGLSLNNKFNPTLKVTMSYTGSARNSSELADGKSRTRTPTPDARAEQMRFEKVRLEMRLKKRAQQLMKP